MSNARRLWLLLSPALPVGGYSYSQGLETAVADSVVTDFVSARAWIRDIAANVQTKVDLAIVLRMVSALGNGDLQRFRYWNEYLRALRETAELRAEDLAMGAALRRLLRRLSGDEAQRPGTRFTALNAELIQELTATTDLTFAGALALAGALWQLEDTEVCDACAWVWCENQVAAAVKLVPLGHSDGQRLLLELADELDGLRAAAAQCSDDDLGMTATGLAIASARHEDMPARQFRS